MVQLPLEVSYKPSLGSSQTYEQDSQDVVCREGNPGNEAREQLGRNFRSRSGQGSSVSSRSVAKCGSDTYL